MKAVTATYGLTYELSPKMTGRRRGKSCLEINLSTGCIDFLFFLVYKVSSGNPQDCTGQACHTFSGIHPDNIPALICMRLQSPA